VLLQTENVNIDQIEFHEYDSMAAGHRGASPAALLPAARR
jgi:hypothetical protein